MTSPAATASTRRQPVMPDRRPATPPRCPSEIAPRTTSQRIEALSEDPESVRIRERKDPNEHHLWHGEKKKRGLRPRDPGSPGTRHRPAELYLLGQRRSEQVR